MTNKLCEGCKVFVADCTTPLGDGAAELCWLCAHAVMVHVTRLSDLSDPNRIHCGCSREEIYPARVLEERAKSAPKLAIASGASASKMRSAYGVEADGDRWKIVAVERRAARNSRLHGTGEHPE